MVLDSTKYIFLVGDGMGDYPLDELGGKTPLEVANTPNMDRIAACRIGLVKTIPNGMPPGSDVANLSLLGYDPKKYHTGRAPFEAASMGVELGEEDIAFRMNLVTLDFRSDDEIIMVSHSSGDITTEEGKAIVATMRPSIESDGLRIFPGVAYRHLLVWRNGPIDTATIPPHDVLGQNMTEYLKSPENSPISRLIQQSWKLLRDHPVNIARRDKGLLEANSIWPWGQGIPPRLPLFGEKFGLTGGVISAVDLIKGIGITVGLRPVYVEGATGYLDTNYSGKAEAALDMLEEVDFMFVHVEAPDEAGHSGIVEDKIKAIEAFDKEVVGRVLK
ncbi:MAG: cofactor-independent phosphoglycerate mutase, partial [Deltaproteobacteria bacterium]